MSSSPAFCDSSVMRCCVVGELVVPSHCKSTGRRGRGVILTCGQIMILNIKSRIVVSFKQKCLLNFTSKKIKTICEIYVRVVKILVSTARPFLRTSSVLEVDSDCDTPSTI